MFHLFSAEVLNSLKKNGLEGPGKFHLTNAFVAVAGQKHAHLSSLPDRDRIMTTQVLDVRNVLRSRPDVGYIRARNFVSRHFLTFVGEADSLGAR
jgi:hypothetical protein